MSPKPHVETVGVRKRGWTLPITDGIAPHLAIDSVVRAVGRIVVCVEAAAEVSTATIRNLTPTEPSTPCAERVQHVARRFLRWR